MRKIIISYNKFDSMNKISIVFVWEIKIHIIKKSFRIKKIFANIYHGREKKIISNWKYWSFLSLTIILLILYLLGILSSEIGRH